MISVRTTKQFDKWFKKLSDIRARAKIALRLRRIQETGNLGDHKGVGDGVSELRFTDGPGYRIYYVEKGDCIIVLLCGGDKDSQDSDIGKAKELSAKL